MPDVLLDVERRAGAHLCPAIPPIYMKMRTLEDVIGRPFLGQRHGQEMLVLPGLEGVVAQL